MPHTALRLTLALGFSCLAASAGASSVTPNFNSFTEGNAITNQIPGVTFTKGTVLAASNGPNEFEDSPHSGANVVFDDGGDISIALGTRVSNLSPFFTYVLTAPAVFSHTFPTMT